MNPYYADDQITLHHGDALDVAREMPSGSVDCIVTSPPYHGLRDYGADGQYGLEASPAEYVERLRALFGELRRVLADDGTLWLNLGDSYNSGGNGFSSGGHDAPTINSAPYTGQGRVGIKSLQSKNLIGIPWRVAFALQDDNWILRNAIIWNKPNAMPESVRDRLSVRYEHVFLFAKQQRYWFDLDPIREDRVVPDAKRTGTQKLRSVQNQSRNASNAESFWNTGIYKSSGRNPGDVWTIPTQPFPQAHFATYPMALPQRAILAGCTPRRCAQCGQKPTPIIDGASDYAERDTSKRNQKWAEVGGGHGDVGRGRNNNLGNYRKTTIGYTDCGHNAYRPGIVLDPFHGSGTTGQAAQHTGRRYIGIDINAEYLDLSLNTRLRNATLDFGTA